MKPCNYFFWSYLKDGVYRTNPYTIQLIQMEIEVVVEQITGNMLRDTVGNSVVPVL
jgi:hypothetical protein